MTQTPILGLNKPQLGDSPPDITKISANLPIIDEALYSVTQKLSNLNVNKFHNLKHKRSIMSNSDLSGFDLNPYYMYKVSSRKFMCDYTNADEFYIETNFDMTNETSAMFTDTIDAYSITTTDTVNINYVYPNSNGLFNFTWEVKLKSGTASTELFYKKYNGSGYLSLGFINIGVGTNTVSIERFANMGNLGGAGAIKLEITTQSNAEIERIKLTKFQIHAYESLDVGLYDNSIDLNLTEDEPLYVYVNSGSTGSLYRGNMTLTFGNKQIDKVLDMDKYYILINKGSYWSATEV